MRIRDYITVASKDLRRQKVRSTLTIIALAISSVILITMAAISLGGRDAITRQFGSDDSLSLITVTPNQSSSTLSPFGNVQEVNDAATKLTDETVAQLLHVDHIASASPRAHIWELNRFSIEGNSKQFVAQAEGLPFDSPLRLRAGQKFANNDAKNVVIIGSAYAKDLGYADPNALVGKALSLTTQKGYRGEGSTIPPATATQPTIDAFNQSETAIDATIVGVTDDGPDQNSLLIPLGWARQIRTAQYNERAGLKTLDQLEKDGYTTIRVTVDQSQYVKAVAKKIQELGYGEISVLAQVEQVQQFSLMMWVILGSVAVIAVIAAALGVANTMLMAVSEQRYTVGVWRAIGARRKTIVRLFLLQAAILGFVGGALGALLGLIVSNYVNEYVNSLLKNQGLAITNIAMIPAWLFAGTIILTIVFSVLAGFYPSRRAARSDPSAALSNGQ